MTIRDIRILPPLAIGRFGSASEPLDNYTVEVDPKQPLGYRRIKGAETLKVNNTSGEISASWTPEYIQFKDGEHIRPVAPFLEVFALTAEGDLKPLDLDMLEGHGLDPSNLSWRIRVENRKVFRRTGNPKDSVVADTGWFRHHGHQELRGLCENFIKDAAISFGNVRYIKPNDQFPQIRLRFTPAHGLVYRTAGIGPDPSVPEKRAVYRAAAAERNSHRKRRKHQSWHGFEIEENSLDETLPPSLFAIEPPAPPWTNERQVSRGYFDDACDGFVEVALDLGKGKKLTAVARICSAPPTFAPDSFLVRSLADELEQAIHGPVVPPDEPHAWTHARAEDIIRRAYETVRFMNVAVLNGNDINGQPSVVDSMPSDDEIDTGRPFSPVMPQVSVDTLAVLALHQQVFAALSGGAPPWFLSLLRQPEEVGDLTDHGRRKMPALMSGPDARYLALTRRQIDTFFKVAQGSSFRDGSAKNMEPAPGRLTPRNLTAQLHYEAAGNPVNSRPMSAIGNCCPGLEFDFRAVWRRLFIGITLSEHNNLVIATDAEHRHLLHHRLLRVDDRVLVTLAKGPSAADPTLEVDLRTAENPEGVIFMEWSNSLAYALQKQGRKVNCYFTSTPSKLEVPWCRSDAGGKVETTEHIRYSLTVRPFFEEQTAVVAAALAEPGELTQGLCSPWQNDFRECSCYYWAASRPDYVNVEPSPGGASHGDNWLQKKRTGRYVVDDYRDPRLINYDDLFTAWESLLKFQIGGKDAQDAEPAPTGKAKGSAKDGA